MTALPESNTITAPHRHAIHLNSRQSDRCAETSAKTASHRIQTRRQINSKDNLASFLIGMMAEKCRIQPGCLDTLLVRSASVCEQRSLKAIHDFCQGDRVLSHYKLMRSQPFFERAALVATEILGADGFLTKDQLEQKSRFHLLMSVQMTAQWLLDEIFDTNAELEVGFAADSISFYLAVLASDDDLAEKMIALRSVSLKNNISEEFVWALFLFAQWQRDLALAVNISLAPESLYSRLHRDLLISTIHIHDAFDSWDQYLQYRSVNCGLTLEILSGAYWYCHLWNIDYEVMEDQPEKYIPLIQRYSILGGVSNDLFGYDKDLGESVATSVEVVKHNLPQTTVHGEDATTRAFLQIIDFHNKRLDELSTGVCSCDNPTERAILFSAMSATWSVRMLHHEYRVIYQPVTLRNVLTKMDQDLKWLCDLVVKNAEASHEMPELSLVR
ncbi:MAG TPA: hypothetical protein VKU00_16415 [Chthonomonadaceae bacterium]|nr:hypothetical protein [Chthonomonadaceae bacterium]